MKDKWEYRPLNLQRKIFKFGSCVYFTNDDFGSFLLYVSSPIIGLEFWHLILLLVGSPYTLEVTERYPFSGGMEL